MRTAKRTNLLIGTGLSLLCSATVCSAAQINALPAAPPSTPPAGASVKQPAPPEINGAMPQAAPGSPRRPRIAFTFAGGGGRGVAHIGVLKVLEQAGIKPDFVCGASTGAVIGGLYAAGVCPQRLEQMALDGELKEAFLPSGLKWQATKTIPLYLGKRLIGMHPPIGLYSGSSISKFVARNVGAGAQVQSLRIPFAAVATDLLDTRPMWITRGNLADALQASASVPYIYRPKKMDGHVLLDGGIRSNLPTNEANASGVDLVIAVRLHGNLKAQPERRFRNFIDYGDRIMTMLMAEIESKAIANADVIIEPDIGNANTYSFDSSDLAHIIAAGEDAARKALPEIQKRIRVYEGAATAKSGNGL